MNVHIAQRPDPGSIAEDTPAHLTVDREVLELLSQRYGDGLVYLHDSGEHPQYEKAVRLGLVSAEGYLTAAGNSLVNRIRLD